MALMEKLQKMDVSLEKLIEEKIDVEENKEEGGMVDKKGRVSTQFSSLHLILMKI